MAVEDIGVFVNAGIDTLDCADHYGDAEAIIGLSCPFTEAQLAKASVDCSISSLFASSLLTRMDTAECGCRQVSGAEQHWQQNQGPHQGLHLGLQSGQRQAAAPPWSGCVRRSHAPQLAGLSAVCQSCEGRQLAWLLLSTCARRSHLQPPAVLPAALTTVCRRTTLQEYIDVSRQRLGRHQLDLLQFYW